LFSYNTKKNPLEFAVSRGLVFIFSFGLFWSSGITSPH